MPANQGATRGPRQRRRRPWLYNLKRLLTPTTTEDRNILYCALDGLTVGLAAPAMAFLSVFVVRLGADAFWVSLLSSLPALVKLLLTLPLSRFVERQTNLVALFAWCRLLGRSAYMIAGILPFFLSPVLSGQSIVILWGMVAVLMGVQQISFTLIMNRSVSRQRRAVMMSGRWTVLGVAKLITLSIAGILLERMPFPLNYQVLFIASFLLSTLGFYTINQIKMIDAPPPSAAAAKPEKRTDAGKGAGIRAEIREVLQQRAFVTFAIARNTYWFGISMVMPLIPIFWVDNLQASDAWIGYFSTALSATTLLSYSFWVRMKRKRGNRKVLLISVFGRSIYPLLVALTPSPPAMLGVALFNGFAFAGLNLMFFDAFMDTLPKGKEARYLAINQTLTNLIGFVAPPVGAWLLGALGMRSALIGGTVMALVGFAVFFLGGVAQGRRPETLPLSPENRVS